MPDNPERPPESSPGKQRFRRDAIQHPFGPGFNEKGQMIGVNVGDVNVGRGEACGGSCGDCDNCGLCDC